MAPAPKANSLPCPLPIFSPAASFGKPQIIANKPIQDGDRVTIEYDFKGKGLPVPAFIILPEGIHPIGRSRSRAGVTSPFEIRLPTIRANIWCWY